MRVFKKVLFVSTALLVMSVSSAFAQETPDKVSTEKDVQKGHQTVTGTKKESPVVEEGIKLWDKDGLKIKLAGAFEAETIAVAEGVLDAIGPGTLGRSKPLMRGLLDGSAWPSHAGKKGQEACPNLDVERSSKTGGRAMLGDRMRTTWRRSLSASGQFEQHSQPHYGILFR